MIKFGIIMSTYKRKDGSTFEKIKKSINCILKQTNKNWKLFLVGDHYDDEEEFKKIIELIPSEKIWYNNLPFAKERESGEFSGHSLWCSAGANASNEAIKKSIEEKVDVICRLDDDDEWTPYHLEILNFGYTNFPQSVFVYTNSFYINQYFPNIKVSEMLEYNNLPPAPEKLIHSSASWKCDKINFFYRNTVEQNRIFPGDADMWERIQNYCQDNNLKTLYIPITTVFKYDEYSSLQIGS
jgi:glycosyltransferase involved in cell wall biosynthesis